MNVIAIGENIIDYYYELNEQYIGGNCINFLMNLKSTSNFKLSYVGPIANDRDGNKIKNFLENEEIDISYVSYLDGKTSRSYIELINGERKFVDFHPGVLNDFILKYHQKVFIKNHDHIHSSIMGGILPFLKDLKDKGTLSFDFSKLNNKSILKATAPLVEYAFLSRERLGDEEHDLIKEIWLSGSKQVILLLGEGGSVVYDGHKFYKKNSMVQGKVVDSLGAGDAYIAGYIEKILRGYSIEEAMEQGSILAAKSCKYKGGFLKQA